MTRRTLVLLALVITLTTLVSASWATVVNYVDINGNFFNPKPGMTQLCAQIYPGYSGGQVEFVGETPYELVFKAKYTYTNAWGKACIKTTWPQGVYEVVASVSVPYNGTLAPVAQYESEPAAVSVFNPFRFCGAQGGGALFPVSYDVPPSVKKTLSPRKITYAFIFKQAVPQNYGLVFFDNDNPLGPVEFEAQSFTDIFYDNRMVGITPYKVVEVYGVGEFEIDGNEQSAHYYMYADDYPGDSSFQLVVWNFAGTILYKSAPANIGPETEVFNGKNVIQPCP